MSLCAGRVGEDTEGGGTGGGSGGSLLVCLKCLHLRNVLGEIEDRVVRNPRYVF